MDDYADGMRLKNTLGHEVHVTQILERKTKSSRSQHAPRLCNLRVSVLMSLHFLLMMFVSCSSSVLLSFFMLYYTVFVASFLW